MLDCVCVCGLQGGLIFVCGSREGLMEVSARLCVCVVYRVVSSSCVAVVRV